METEEDSDGLEWWSGCRLTKGKIYRILSWEKTEHVDCYCFKDDTGETIEWAGYWGVEDCSFEKNLKLILE